MCLRTREKERERERERERGEEEEKEEEEEEEEKGKILPISVRKLRINETCVKAVSSLFVASNVAVKCALVERKPQLFLPALHLFCVNLHNFVNNRAHTLLLE